MTRWLKSVAYVLAFPIYSLFSRRVGFCVFVPVGRQWWAFTRGRFIRVPAARLWVLEYFRHFVPPRGGLVFDVGGELGRETAQFARLVGPQGKVLTFECLPAHVEHLKRVASHWPNVQVVERACWNHPTELEFFSGHTPGSGTAVPTACGQTGQELADRSKGLIRVQAQTLDNLWSAHANRQPVDFLKMDIEGAEYEALEGASEMLSHTRMAVIAAYHIRDGVPTAPKVATMLRSAGFRVRIDENNHVYAIR